MYWFIVSELGILDEKLYNCFFSIRLNFTPYKKLSEQFRLKLCDKMSDVKKRDRRNACEKLLQKANCKNTVTYFIIQ